MTKLHQHPTLCEGNLPNDLNFQNLQENDLLYSQFLEKIGKDRTSVPRIVRVDGSEKHQNINILKTAWFSQILRPLYAIQLLILLAGAQF